MSAKYRITPRGTVIETSSETIIPLPNSSYAEWLAQGNIPDYSPVEPEFPVILSPADIYQTLISTPEIFPNGEALGDMLYGWLELPENRHFFRTWTLTSNLKSTNPMFVHFLTYVAPSIFTEAQINYLFYAARQN